MNTSNDISKAAAKWFADERGMAAELQIPVIVKLMFDRHSMMEAEIMKAASISELGRSAAADAVAALARHGLTSTGKATTFDFELFMCGYAVGAADVGRLLVPEAQTALVEAFREGTEKKKEEERTDG